MSSTVSKHRRIWNSLNPRDDTSGFDDQVVALPTAECPSGSLVGDDVWYFPHDLIGKPAEHLRALSWNLPIAGGMLTDSSYRPLLAICKSITIGFMNKLKRRKHLSLATIRKHASCAVSIASFVAGQPWKNGARGLKDLTPDDGVALARTLTQGWRPGSNTFSQLRSRLKEIRRLGDSGKLSDAFAPRTFDALIGEIEEIGGEHSPSNMSEFSAVPYSNQYCLDFLNLHDFLTDEVADDLFVHVAEVKRLENMNDGELHYQAFAQTHPWRARKLSFAHSYSYPPETRRDVVRLAGILQVANLKRIAMATAGREGELLWMERGCLSKFAASDTIIDLITSRRHKNSSHEGGNLIGWPVGRSAARAVEIQERLADAADSPHLWLKMANGRIAGRLSGCTARKVQRFAELHNLDTGKDLTATLQRFRPTMALLLITAEKGHPHLVRMVLGHENMKTTTKYLRMNPRLRADLDAAINGGRVERGRAAQEVSVSRSEALAARDLDVILRRQKQLGARARILAFEVIAFSTVKESDASLPASDVSGLEYALTRLSRREVRALPELRDWLCSEAIRISKEVAGAERALNPKLRSMLAGVRSHGANRSSLH